MNQCFWNGLTAALLVSTLGVTSVGLAQQTQVALADADIPSDAIGSPQATSSIGTVAHSASLKIAASTQSATGSSTAEVLKVGERQSQDNSEQPTELVAKIYPHRIHDRDAATLYVRNIPVLTFLGSPGVAASGRKSTASHAASPTAGDQAVKVATSTQQMNGILKPDALPENDPSNPVWRATEIAAKLNQLNHQGLDAQSITANWKGQGNSAFSQNGQYLIKVGDDTLVSLDQSVILPDSTGDPEQDVLQATNRLRRLLGNAEPLQTVAGKPKPNPSATQIAFGPVRFQLNGWASWYGPGFNGNLSASGEVFNQNDLTAAHPSLPFGTQVRVTNLDNGRSVVVRINDRGPYAHDRIIDLSAAAAQVIGMINSGTAPVQLDVLGVRSNAVNTF